MISSSPADQFPTHQVFEKPVGPISFAYVRPAIDEGRSKKVEVLARTDRAVLAAQVIAASGGENNLHSHAHLDGFWLVKRGRARFYTTGDELIADLGELEGVLVPRGTPYWFEAVATPDGADLELLQFEVSDIPMPASFDDVRKDRTDYEPLKPGSQARG